MSYHSSAFPIETATTSLVKPFSREDSGSVTGADSAISNLLIARLEWTRHFAEIPKQAGHDAERFLGEVKQDVLVGRMLRTGGIGVRHPDRRQTERIGEHVIGQRAAEIRQHRRPPARGLPDRFRRPIDPWTVEIGARGDKALGPADLDHRKAAGAQMRPHTVDHGVEFGADHKAKLQHGTRLSGNSVGGLADIARRYRQYLQRVPGVEPLSRRQAVLAPIV